MFAACGSYRQRQGSFKHSSQCDTSGIVLSAACCKLMQYNIFYVHCALTFSSWYTMILTFITILYAHIKYLVFDVVALEVLFVCTLAVSGPYAVF